MNRVILGFILCRLVFVPAAILGIYTLIPADLMMPEKPLAQLIMLLSAGMPSAQILLIFLIKFDMEESSAQLSFLFCFQYAAALFTMTGLGTVALDFVYG